MRRFVAGAFALFVAVVAQGVVPAFAAVPQRPWTEPEACQSPGGPQNIQPGTLYYDASGPGAMVNGNYIGFVCNFGFQRNGTGYTAGVAVTVDYCGGSIQPFRREEGNYTTYAGQFTVRQQQWLLHGGALITIVLYTNKTNGSDHFTTQEMVTGSQNLADLNRPQGAVPCPNGGTTQNPGGGGTGGWAVSLTADFTNLIAGNDFNLTATANKNVSGTGFRVFIVNQTDNSAVFCQTGSICPYKDYKNEPGSRVYVAVIANSQGQDVQATSAPLTVTWSAWSGSITLTTQTPEVDAGEVVNFTATASPTVNGTIYKIRIERQDNGQGGECLESPCVKNDYYDAGVTHHYVAKVLRHDGTDLRATSAPLKVVWKATEEWDGVVSLRTAGGVESVGFGVLVVLEAFTSPPLDNTDYVVKILEQVPSGQGQSQTCGEGNFERCTMVVTSPEETSRFFQAVVVRRDGTGGVKATSNGIVTISWVRGGSHIPCLDGWKAVTVTGNATVLIGDRQRVPLKPGQWICPQDTVETDANSTVEGEYEERGLFNPNAGPEVGYKATVKMKPRTSLSLNFFSQGVHYTFMDLTTGGAEFFVNGAARSDFRIKSPTAVASVRGTTFSVDYDPAKGETHVQTFESEVLVTPTNAALSPVSLFGGDQITVDTDSKTPVTKIFGTLQHKRRLPAVTREGPN